MKDLQLAMSLDYILKGFRHAQLLQMCDEGYINLDFCQIIRQGNANNPYYVVQVINVYCAEMDSLLFRLCNCTDQGYVNFTEVDKLCRTAEQKSKRIGAERVLLECSYLVQACEKRNIKDFSEALYYVNNEFSTTKNKLRDYAQLEKRIVNMELEQKKD